MSEKTDTVKKIQEYIGENINLNITLKSISEYSGYSPWHTERIFKEVTGKNLFSYIRDLRLSKAAITLRDNKIKVIDVAFDFVFDSPEGFARAFSRKFGISPKKYSKNPEPIKLFIPYMAYDRTPESKGDDYMGKDVKAIFVQVIERPERKALILRGKKAKEYFGYCEEVGCDVWGVLSSVKEALYEPIGMWLPDNMIKEGTSKYIQGVEVPLDYSNKIPEGYELITLKPCKMMVFQGEPYEDENFSEAVSEVMKKIDKFDPGIYGYEWNYESDPSFQLAPMGYRGYIEARPVKEKK
ncbi:MAG TPA: AraC family transcriptional regulator [Tepiditoga sp.]|nr:helix-turn-helix transcriptional regulator [Thermotogota bacterium]HOO73678.1 AraC family transcriptional regulator [Tepiditoga sp.]